jgi:hypothetical protein
MDKDINNTTVLEVDLFNMADSFHVVDDFLKKYSGGARSPGGGITITNNITINFIDVNAATKKYSQGIKNLIVVKIKENSLYLAIHQHSAYPDFLAAGFFASCSFKNKKDLPIWVGFQYRKPSLAGTPEKLTFSIELLDRKAWEKEGLKEETMAAYSYTSDDIDDAFYKSFSRKTFRTGIRNLYKCLKKELKDIEKRLS